MKNQTKKLIVCYYLVLAIALIAKVTNTVYAGSMVVDHGKKIQGLEEQKRELDYQKSILTQEIANNQSLPLLAEVAKTNNYSPISRPIFIVASDNVASAL